MKTIANYILIISAIAMIGHLMAGNIYSVDFTTDEEKGIRFHRGSWQEALALAKKENKIIFLDVYASWCGPCKQLKSTTFPDEKVGTYYNQHFINVIVDGEKGEGADLAKKYNVRAYPTLLFIDSNGNVVLEKKGYYNPNELVKIGKSIKTN